MDALKVYCLKEEAFSLTGSNLVPFEQDVYLTSKLAELCWTLPGGFTQAKAENRVGVWNMVPVNETPEPLE